MKLLGWFLVLSLALAVLKVAVVALAVGCMVLLLVGIVARPRETMALLAYSLLCGAINRFGLALLLPLLGIILMGHWMKAKEGSNE